MRADRDEAAVFFRGHETALRLYSLLEEAMDGLGEFSVEVKKTQISFRRGCIFACASLRKLPGVPGQSLILTLMLPYRLESPRVLQAVQAGAGRWTHHIAVAAPGEIGGELLNWLREAYEFGLFRSLRRGLKTNNN